MFHLILTVTSTVIWLSAVSMYRTFSAAPLINNTPFQTFSARFFVITGCIMDHSSTCIVQRHILLKVSIVTTFKKIVM